MIMLLLVVHLKEGLLPDSSKKQKLLILKSNVVLPLVKKLIAI